MSEFAIRLHIEPLEEGGYLATSPDVQGLVVEGRTRMECVEFAQDVARKIAETCIEHGDPLPEIFRSPGLEVLEFTIPVQIAS
jgi:antitoxin HicB